METRCDPTGEPEMRCRLELRSSFSGRRCLFPSKHHQQSVEPTPFFGMTVFEQGVMFPFADLLRLQLQRLSEVFFHQNALVAFFFLVFFNNLFPRVAL